LKFLIKNMSRVSVGVGVDEALQKLVEHGVFPERGVNIGEYPGRDVNFWEKVNLEVGEERIGEAH